VETAFILAVVGLTSLGAALLMRRHARRGLGSAAARTLETIGLAVVFLCLNVAVGFCLALIARPVAGGFVSLYLNDDATIGALSALQALLVQWWREPEAR
jgi:hypothetical protein